LKVEDSKFIIAKLISFIYCIIKDEKWYADEEAPSISPEGGRNLRDYAID
jgi:hypothetical protein